LKRTLNIIRRTILIILAFVVIIFITIQTDYVQNKLIKIEQGRVGASTDISPNGCRVLAYIKRDDPVEKIQAARRGYMVMDLCK
jgi:hypothetical protein